MVLLRLTGEGEVFYRQARVGRYGKNFALLKFATMLKNSPLIGTGEITVRNDPRILPLGGVLRKTKLNELPQLWNVLIGDMSIVGPRPMVPDTFSRYPKDAQAVLQTVRPGLTGVGSIIFRDEERYLDGLDDPVGFYRDVIIPYKSELEMWYVAHQSVGLYWRVIVVTAWIVVFPSSELPQSAFLDLPLAPEALMPKRSS
jgi:lipopolysaccharide/colanic/teichoic acid biosynthesis glycosyltransferase